MRRTATLAAVAVLAMFGADHAMAAAGLPTAVKIGAPAPSGPLDLTRFKGKVIYLDFWASWCAPCKVEFPFMDRLAATFPADRFMVITVDVDKDHDKGVAWLTKIGSRLPVVYDADGAIARSYGVAEMPTTLLIDRKGTVRYLHSGFTEDLKADYAARVASLLAEK